LKFDADTNVVANKAKRAAILKKVTPSNFKNTLHFISYDWIEGSTLYEKDSLALYTKFLTFLKSLITNSSRIVLDASVFDEFYVTKTEKRRTAFVDRFGERYYTEPYTINGVNYPPLKDVLSTVDLQQFHNNPTYDMFHGDLQFDNIIHSTDSDERFTYIDWRESFGGCVEGGDIYYDLAKLYGGCIIPYNLAKDDRFIRYTEGLSFVQFEHDTLPNLHKFKSVYEQWIVDAGFDLNKVKTLTAIIFLNMSPLHSDVFAKLLWFKSVQMLTDVNK
jgi:thiamine kinase-like enzyme